MKKPHEIRYCPLCNKLLRFYSREEIYTCPTILKFQGNKKHSHFKDFGDSVVMIVMPFRITSWDDSSHISIHIPPDSPKANSLFQSGKWLFKTIMKLNLPIAPMEESKLLNRVKTIVTFS